MDCDDCVERLYAFLDTELTKAEIIEVRSHLEGCDDCDDNFLFEARFLQQLRDCCTTDVAPAELRQRVILKLRAASAPPTTT
ncbi:MAG: mycothiol system anti-sigma-R factor [Chloroflexi bacterium]|nr:MAG: mycothiol system anti-sigma-R factor [Chloroflexota bacterium]TMB92636.1 MAG: mycothiol system anti-sigma-R factor [Chloroflexota bacterium]TMC30941.1 MAG: mycothiol system anti-sigma-R factor [Chloroflexota bacterium]TMC33606.1 MAG: mycothiol system anti-sigma-R factor [Chloroflexota bacterium]TMC56331.1 MAG: mycothiol system anti-sigma-R factor [Chloroflexota bacterium]